MNDKRYCIICGLEITSKDPKAIYCESHTGLGGEQPAQPTPVPQQPEVEQLPPAQSMGDLAKEWPAGKTLLDTYQVVRKLGEGGFGQVYRVHHTDWDMDLAVKRPLADKFKTDKAKEAFIREAETWVGLGLHPHITSCYYVRKIDEVPHVFVECVEGGSLEDWINRKKGNLYEGSQSQIVGRILDIAIQFAWGLAYAHEQGLIHRDVKPDNALMTPEGMLKVTDFGLARGKGIMLSDEKMDAQGNLIVPRIYSPKHCSPEQVSGAELSLKTDIWSWGVSVLQMFNGSISWMGGQVVQSSLESYLMRMETDTNTLQMPQAVSDLLRECFEARPEDRPADMTGVARRLQDAFREVTGQAYPREKPDAADLRAASLNNKALTMIDLGHEDLAIQNWKEALDTDPAHGETNLNYQTYLWWHAEITDDELLANLAQVSGTNMDSPGFWKGMAELHAERGDVKEWEECLKKALQLNPTLSVSKEKNSILQKTTLKGHSQQVFPLLLSPNQEVLASSGSDGTIRLWDVKSERCIKTLTKAGFTPSLAFSPDGKEMASGSSDRTVRLWNVSKGRLIKQLKGHTDVVTSVAFSKDGQYIISGSLDGSARVWEKSSGRCIQEYTEHRHWVLSIDIPDEGNLALTAGRDQTVRLWEITTGETVRVYERPQSPRKAEYGRGCVRAGKVLWAGYDSMCLWDYESGHLVTQFLSCQEKGAIDPYMTGDLSQDGKLAVTLGNNGEKRFWDTSTGRCIATIPSSLSGGSVIFGPENKLYCAVGKDIEVWQVKLSPDRRFFHYLLSMPASSVVALEKQSQLKEQLDLVKDYQGETSKEKALQILRSIQSDPEFKHDEKVLNQLAECALSGEKIGLRECWMHSAYHLDKPEGTGGVTALRFNFSTSMLAAGHRDGSVHCFDLRSRKKVNEMQRHIGQVEAFSFPSPDSLLSFSRNGDLILWDLNRGTGRVVSTTLDDPNKGAHLSASLDEDGQYVLVQGLRGYSRVPVHLDRLEPLPERPYRPLVIRANPDLRLPVVMKDTLNGYEYRAATSPDGTLFTSSMGDSRYGRGAHPVFVWQVSTGGISMYRRFIGHTNPVLTMAFSRNQTELVTADLGGEIRIWDLSSDTCKRTIKQPSSQFTALAISPDNKFIVAGDSQGKLFLWDHDSKQLLNIQPHRGVINALAFSSDGRFAVSGGFDNQIQVWEFDWEYQFPRPVNWDERAAPLAEIFLTRHQSLDPMTNIPSGRPVWNTKDLKQFLNTLAYSGFGWLREDGVRRKLEELAGRRR